MNRKCRICDKTDDMVPFHGTKNLCKDDYNTYMKKWKTENAEHLKEYRSTPDFKRKRAASVKRTSQSSPENFIKALMYHLTKSSNYKKKNLKKLNPVCLDVSVDYNFLLELYRKQNGRCAVSNIIMTYEFNNLLTISIDRIDSAIGYSPENVQLVCQWVNTAKKHHNNSEILEVMRLVREASPFIS